MKLTIAVLIACSALMAGAYSLGTAVYRFGKFDTSTVYLNSPVKGIDVLLPDGRRAWISRKDIELAANRVSQ